MINLLYSILTFDIPDSELVGFYAKKREFVLLDKNQLELVQLLSPPSAGSADRLRLACFACGEALRTCFGPEIRRLDPNNTYFPAGRDPQGPLNGLSDCVYNLLPGFTKAGEIKYMLDADIVDRLVIPCSIEILAAGGLQLLRECNG